MLKKWYNVDNAVKEYEANTLALSSKDDILVETDSEADGHGCPVLLQSDSEQEELVATPPDDDILLATDSEGETCGEPPAKKPRSYTTNRNKCHELHFLGKPVCRFAHQRLYSVGSNALQRLRRGQRAFTMNSGRLREPMHPSWGIIGKDAYKPKVAFHHVILLDALDQLCRDSSHQVHDAGRWTTS